MDSSRNAIILCSGGLDSAVTSYYVKKRLKYNKIITLFFNYNQKSVREERASSKKCSKEIRSSFIEATLPIGELVSSVLTKKSKIKKITRKELKDSLKESKRLYVPCRNTIFLAYSLALAESLYKEKKEKYDIFVGFKCEGKEAYPDTTKKFVDEMNRLSKISCYKSFRIIAPLIRKDKEDIIRLGLRLGVNLKSTFSCYSSANGKHCGCCLACRLRQEGFYWANVPDPTNYDIKMKDFRSA